MNKYANIPTRKVMCKECKEVKECGIVDITSIKLLMKDSYLCNHCSSLLHVPKRFDYG